MAGKPVPPFVTPIVGKDDKVIADVWQRYFVNLYAEGQWLPTLGGSTSSGGQVYSNQGGFWVKQGRLVTLTGFAGLSSLGTMTGPYVIVGGLPWTSQPSLGGVPWWIGATYFDSLATPLTSLDVVIFPGQRVAYLSGVPSPGNTSRAWLAPANLTNSSAIAFTVQYLAQD